MSLSFPSPTPAVEPMKPAALTPLQRMALARIEALEQAIEQKFGLKVCSGMELEFFRRDALGHLTPLRGKEPLVNSPVWNEVNGRYAVEGNAQQFEVIFGPGYTSEPNADSAPHAIAAHALSAREHIIQRLPETNGVHAHFTATEPQTHQETGGLHANLSIWNSGYAQNKTRQHFDPNFFGSNKKAARYVTAQAALLPLLIESEDSLARYGSIVSSTPTCFRFNRKLRDKCTLNIQGNGEEYRLENRLPGADADPILAMLAAVGALYYSLDHTLKYEPAYAATVPSSAMAYGANLRQFTQSAVAKEILGDTFYQRICDLRQQQYRAMTIPQAPEAEKVHAGMVHTHRKTRQT